MFHIFVDVFHFVATDTKCDDWSKSIIRRFQILFWVLELGGHNYEALATLQPRKSFVGQPMNNRVYGAK
jgi:hypothetical protein